eukprot:3311095-Prymnesium_polylepis.1
MLQVHGRQASSSPSGNQLIVLRGSTTADSIHGRRSITWGLVRHSVRRNERASPGWQCIYHIATCTQNNGLNGVATRWVQAHAYADLAALVRRNYLERKDHGQVGSFERALGDRVRHVSEFLDRAKRVAAEAQRAEQPSLDSDG